MFKRNPVVKINIPGGIIAAGDFYTIIKAAEEAGIDNIQLGTRQQLFLKTTEKQLYGLQYDLKESGIFFETDNDQYPNIVSSYVGEGIFENAAWLSEGVYKDILDLFDYKPRLKINLVEHAQTFVPFFTGNINFISSPVNNYWYLYIRFPKTHLIYKWKTLVYSFDIPGVSNLIETAFSENQKLFSDKKSLDGNILYTIVHAKGTFITQPITEELKLPDFNLPYYEGMNKMGNKSWLGIYRRDELFPVSFLKDICRLCLQTKVGQLYTTPWKSLIIKGIERQDGKLWGHVLGKHRINVRHASNELNWQVEDLSEEGLTLKRYLIRQFDKDDVRTSGLSFAVKTQPKAGLFGSVIIRIQVKESSRRKALDRYDILYTKDFNPNTRELVLFRQDIEKENLGVYLVALCKYFYELQSQDESLLHHIFKEEQALEEAVNSKKISLFQCKHCLTIYDERYGDATNGIAAGTAFRDVPYTYECPVCSAPEEDFILIEKEVPQSA